MHSETTDVQTPDGTADCYLTRPSDDGPHPAVLLMIDAIGLRPRIEEMADRIARDGYVVLAPNVFYRAGRAPLWETPDFADAEDRGRFMQALRPVMAELTADRIAADGGAYLERLAELSDGPVGITGYCMGGRLAWTIAASHPDRVVRSGRLSRRPHGDRRGRQPSSAGALCHSGGLLGPRRPGPGDDPGEHRRA